MFGLRSRFWNLTLMIPVLKMVIAMGLYPPCVSEKKYRESKVHKVFVVLIACSLPLVCVFKLHDYNIETSTIVVMHTLKTVCTTLQCVVAVVGNSIIHARTIHKMRAKLEKLDMLTKTPSNSDRSTFVVIEVFVYLALIIGISMFTTVLLRNELNLMFFAWFLCDFIENCLCFTMTLIILHYLMYIQYKFRTLNAMLADCIDNLKKHKKTGTDYDAPEVWIETYTILTEVIDLFNDAFGWQILYIFINSLLGMLAPINHLIVGAESGLNLRHFGIVLRYVFFIVVSGVSIVKVADNTYSEERATGLLCYKILQNIPTDTMWSNMFNFREEMIFFAKQTSLRCPPFSAAGFLTVDYSMLFMLINSISTYVVVLIQFNK